ncbi:hypothetical protein BRADI_4g09812v3 [Brachypodium distachyon]|uniref:Uncharacterized protein n=1 Tax=Brachypodium distachyon TaxID=15368 RepID=A0A2K2CLM6_BRADI|nr:hypothetical protein BRADI_4g09812v3 [Brachypodium distachyon]
MSWQTRSGLFYWSSDIINSTSVIFFLIRPAAQRCSSRACALAASSRTRVRLPSQPVFFLLCPLHRLALLIPCTRSTTDASPCLRAHAQPCFALSASPFLSPSSLNASWPAPSQLPCLLSFFFSPAASAMCRRRLAVEQSAPFEPGQTDRVMRCAIGSTSLCE